MATSDKNPYAIDGSLDFSGGVDSVKVTTVQSPQNPNGLARNQLAWLWNATVRDGGITQRTGWQYLLKVHDGSGLYQGGFMYEPDSANPYLVLSISGHIYKVDVEAMTVQELINGGPFTNPATQPAFNPPGVEQAYFVQGENYLIIQAGDYGSGNTLPLFWDGNVLTRSIGITTQSPPQLPSINQIPAALAMDYYMGRIWYAQSRQYSAGDIVGGPSGNAVNHFRDSILSVTENPLCVGGDGFTVPTNAGNIRAIKHSSQLDANLGQGRLYIGTRRAIYSLTVPVTRSQWIAADNNNQPLQTVAQLTNGFVNDRSVVPVNGDLYYQSLEPSIRSLVLASRFFQTAGNISISNEEERALQFNDRSLMHAASGVFFDNRLLQCILPKKLPQGIVHQAILPLDFIPMSTMEANQSAIWEGMYEGLQVLQLFTGDFGGLERCFAITVSEIDSSIGVWELTTFLRSDFNQLRAANNPDGESRVTWVIEFPAYTWGKEQTLKRLVSADLWIDKLFGDVEFTLEYREDSNPCWRLWHRWKRCAARTTCEDVNNPVCYPAQELRESYRNSMVLPAPPTVCNDIMKRPGNVGYQFQPKLTIKGWCRVRSIRLFAEPVQEALYHPEATC